jgi:predicted ArsR family transcriptional regulator
MGRPSFDPSEQQRAQVEAWVKAKVSIEEMARRMKLAAKTFRKHFAQELGLIPVETVITALETARPRTSVFRPTDEQREMALILAGAQLSHPEIARKLGLPVEVLQEHFAEELEKGPIKCKSDILAAMFYAGKGGNVAAAKVYLLFNGQEPSGGPDQPAAAGLKGKKEVAAIAAQSAERGTGWEDLVPSDAKPN